MSTVDNRVVRMIFDNAQFEKNIKTTQKSIEEFEKSLKLDGATTSFDELSKAANKLDLSAMSKKASDEASKIESVSAEASESISKVDDAAQNADFSPLSASAQDASQDVTNALSNIDMSSIQSETSKASEAFSALEVVATGALLKIGESISDLVTGGLAGIGNKIKQFTFDPITEGFKEYETQMGSIQTIMANADLNFSSDEDIALVNSKLDELNTYADKTIYNFTEMTRNIGTFTAAGVGLDESTKAIQGIANMAALSGSNSQQASTAMYQLSQALASGSLKLQDWNSVVNAGMGGQVFQESLKRTARAHGIAVDQMIADNGSFRESLKDGWISSEILTETLNQMSISYERVGDEAYNAARQKLLDANYSEQDADAILKLAKKAELAATEVRTWTQLWDTVGEAIGSNWSQIWRNVIGDFKQATDTFTFLSEKITGAIDGMLGGIVHASEIFNTSGAIGLIFGSYVRNEEGERVIDEITGTTTRIKGAIDYLAEAIGKPLGAIKEAFDSIFGMDDETLGITITSIAMAFRDFTQTLIISDDAAIAIKNIFEGLFSILDIGIQIVMDLGAAFFGIVDFVRSFLDPIIDSVLTIFGQLGRIIKWVHDRFIEVRSAIIVAIKPFLELIGVVRDVISALFGFADIPGHIRGVGDIIIEFLNLLWGFIDIPGIIQGIGEAFGSIFHFIGDLTGWNAAVEESNKTVDEAGNKVSALDIWIKKLLENPVIGFFKGIVDAIGGFISKVKDGIVNVLHLNDTGEKLTLPGIFKKIADSVIGALGPVGEFVSKAGEGFSRISDIVGRLGSAFGNFASKIGEAFMAWEPIKNVANKLNEFKNGAINFFLSLPDRLSGTADGVKSPLGSIQESFGGVIDWFNNVINYFSNVSVEQFIEDVKSWANGVIENIKNVFNYFTTTSPEQIFEDFIESLHVAVNILRANLFKIAGPIGNMFPEIKDAIVNGIMLISRTLHDWVRGIHDFIAPVLAESNSIPEFFVKLFVKIGSAIKDGVVGIFETIRNIKPEDIFAGFENIMNFFRNIATNIESSFPALEGVFTGKLESIFMWVSAFYNDVTKDTNNFGDILSNIVDKIGENLSKVPDVVGGGLSWIKDRLVEGASWLANILQSIPGPVGEFFTFVIDNIKKLEGPINDALDWIKNLFDSIKSFIFGGSNQTSSGENPVEDMISPIADTDVEEQAGGFGTIIDKIKAFFDGKLKKLNDFLFGIPSRLGEMLGGFIEKLNKEGVIRTVINIIQQVLVAKLLWSLGDFVKGVGNLTNVAAKYLKQEKVKSFSDKFKDIAIAFGVIAASLFVISKIENPWACVGVLTAIGAVVVIMEAISGKICKSFDSKAGDQLLKAAATIGVFAASVLLVMYTVKKLTAFDWGGNLVGLLAMGGALAVLTGLVVAITRLGGNGGSEAIKAAASIAILAVAVNLLMPPIKALTEFAAGLNSEQFKQAAIMFGILGAFVVAMGGALKLAGDNALKAGAGFLLLGASISLISNAISTLATVNFESLKAAFVGLVAIIGEFAIIAWKVNSTDLLKASAAMLIFGASVAAMAISLNVLAKNDWGQILASAGAIGILIGALAALAYFTKEADLMVTSAALIVFSGAIGIMTIALSSLANLDTDKLMLSAAALSILIVVFGALAIVLSQQGIAEMAIVILPLLALAFIAVGAAALLIANALSIAVDAIIRLAESGDTLASFVALIAQHLADFAMAALAFVALGAGMGVLAAGMGVLAIAMIAFGGATLVAAGGIAALTFALNGLLDFAERLSEFSELGSNITAGIGEGMANGLDGLANIVMGIINAIIGFFTGGFKINSPSELMADEIGKYIPEGIGMGIGDNSGNLMETLGGTLGELLGKFSTWVNEEGLPKLREFGEGLLDKLQNEILPNITNWIEKEGIPKLGEMAQGVVDHIFEELGKMPGRLLEWASEIPGKIWEGIKSAWNTITEIGGNIIDGIIEGIKAAPGAIADAVVGMASGGLDAIKNFFGIASPSKVMRDEVGRYIPEGLAVGINQYSGVAERAGEDLGQSTIDGVNSSLNSAQYGITNPEITPVLDMGLFNQNLEAYRSSIATIPLNGQMDISGTSTLRTETSVRDETSVNINAEALLDSLGGSLIAATDKINNTFLEHKDMTFESLASIHNNMSSQTYDLVSELSAMNERIEVIKKNLDIHGHQGLQYIDDRLSDIQSFTYNTSEYLKNGSNVYMDTGALVGAIAPEIDSALGFRRSQASRGVI